MNQQYVVARKHVNVLSTHILVDDCRTFFFYVRSLLSMIEYQESIDVLLYAVLIVSILRIIQCTSLHPRLAHLTGTLSVAMDDLWHTTMHIFLVLGLFAAVGTWRFGSTRKEFATITESLSTQLNMMFSGGFVENWNESLDLQVFTLLFLIMVVLLILNFLLANIVGSFSVIQKHSEELDIEQNFLSDVFWVSVSRFYQYFYKWPDSRKLVDELNSYKLRAKFNISFDHLKQSCLFPNNKSLFSFLLFYRDFEFLKPIQISKFGKEPKTSQERKMFELKKFNDKLFVELYSKLTHSGLRFVDKIEKRKLSVEAQGRDYVSNEMDSKGKTVGYSSSSLCFLEAVKWTALPVEENGEIPKKANSGTR